ncbi:hypothetical protein BH10BAC4_BH10BAC4_24440 [soil metagenome]
MKTIDVDKELEHLKQTRQRSWPKLISRLKKQLDHRMVKVAEEKGHGHFKLGYMPFLMNIDLEGITNNDLSKRFGVTKQATSKIINELVTLKYVTVAPHVDDKRSGIVYLTDRGKKFVVEAKHCGEGIMNEYRELLGKKEFDNLIDMLVKIHDYNESKGLTTYM